MNPEREVQDQLFVDTSLRMARAKAAKEFLTTRQLIVRARENEDRYNGGATPAAAPPTRHTRLLSPTRKLTQGVPSGLQFPEFTSDRGAEARQALLDRRNAYDHSVYYDRIQVQP